MTQEFKDHIVEHPYRFKRVPVPGKTDEFDMIPTWQENPSEVVQLGTPMDRQLFEGITSQLADIETRKASKSEVNTLATAKANQTEVNDIQLNKADRTYVDTQVAAIDRGVGGTYTNLSAIQTAFPSGDTKRYVAADNGNWYYWNGSAWVSGGLFQAIGIADKSVTTKKLQIAELGKNLFNKNDVIVDRYITDTNSLVFSGPYNVANYIPVSANTQLHLNIVSFGNILCYDASYNFLGICSRNGNVFTTLANTAYVRFTVTDANLDTTQLEVGTEFSGYEEYGYKIPVSQIRGVPKSGGATTKTRVTVGSSNADFSTISSALASITDASIDNQYEIFIYKGTYNEGNFRSKNYVDIIGQDKYKTIVNYVGDVATWNDTSTLFAESEMKLANLTLIGTDTKYPLHIDKATGKWTCVVENVVMLHKGSLTDPVKAGTPLGIGLYEGQHLIIKNCLMVYQDAKGTQAFGASGVYFHNQVDNIGDGYRSIRIEECEIKGVTYGIRPNDVVVGGSTQQKNDAYIINNSIRATHQEYYYPENSPAWNLFKKGNEYTQGA